MGEKPVSGLDTNYKLALNCEMQLKVNFKIHFVGYIPWEELLTIWTFHIAQKRLRFSYKVIHSSRNDAIEETEDKSLRHGNPIC